VRKVVDCSSLESPELAEFLARSRGNEAVLTDFCVMESLNRGEGVRQSYRILAGHPRQVVVLETTPQICRLRPRSKGLAGRLVDAEATERFTDSCAVLVAGASLAHTNFALKQEYAERFIAELTPAADEQRGPMLAMMRKHSAEDLNILRSQKRLTVPFLRRAEEHIARMTEKLYGDVPGFGPLPGYPEVLQSFPFRLAVCNYALATHWTWKGGLDSWPAPKLRNDITDCTYAAHASFFDGLISGDGRGADVYNLAMMMLKGAFGLGALTVRKIPGDKIGAAGRSRGPAGKAAGSEPG
jgi:hypothetical protein